MPNYSALIGFDTTQLKLHQNATHYIVKAIVVSAMDVEYESNISFLPVANCQGLVEVQFETHPDMGVLLLMHLELVEQYDLQFHVKENMYFHSVHTLQLHDQRELISYENEQLVINSEVIVTELNIEGAVRFPLVELNFQDFQFPISQFYLSNFLAVEIQTDTVRVLKYFTGRCCDLSGIIVPYVEEILVKVVFVVKFYEIQHRFTIFNSKVIPNQGLTKGVLYSVTEIDPKFDLHVFSLIDNIIATITSGNDVFKDAEGLSVKMNSILTPGFLNRWLLFKNPKIVDINKPKFQECPWVIETENKKLSKILQQEISACEQLSEEVTRHAGCIVRGSVMFYIETSFLPKEESPSELFADVQIIHKSIAMLAARIEHDSDGFGFLVLSNKEIPHEKLVQEFELGSGNLAVCNPTDKKQYLEVFHKGNPSLLIKLLMNNTKSLLQSSAKGISMNMLLYEIGFDFQLQKLCLTKEQMEQAINSHIGCIDRRLSASCSVRLYLEDMIYLQEKTETTEYPTVPADAEEEGETSGAVDALRMSNASFTRESLASVAFVIAHKPTFEPQKLLSYFGGRTAVFFFIEPRRPLRTFIDSLLDEERRIAEEERKKAEEEERRQRALEEERALAEAERLMREELERQEEARKEEERRRKEEQEQQMMEEQSLTDAQVNAIKFAEFEDTRKREMDEIQRKMMAEKLQREEEEKEELRRKMELKKLRNLKWEQQIQRFIVKDRGKIDTFYNDKMDVEDRKIEEKPKVLPKIKIQTLLTHEETAITPQFDMSLRPQIQESLADRAKAGLIRIKEKQLARTEVFEDCQSDGELSEVNLENILEAARLKTKELVISPIIYTNSNKEEERSVHRLLGRLYSSPLNIRGEK